MYGSREDQAGEDQAGEGCDIDQVVYHDNRHGEHFLLFLLSFSTSGDGDVD